MKTIILPLCALFWAVSTIAADQWSTTHVPQSSYILLQYNKSSQYICTASGCSRVKLPFKYGFIAQNFKNSYRVFYGWGVNVADQTQKAVWAWNPAKGVIKKYAVTVGNRKWPSYSENASYILPNGTVIGEFMINDKRNMGYAKLQGKRERPLAQFWRHSGSHHYIFRPNGSYIAIDAPGTMRKLTAPFSNQVRGFPHVIYKGNSLFARARKLSSRPAYLSVHFCNNYKHVSYWKLGRYKGDSSKGDWRILLVEILNTKTGKTKVIGSYKDILGPPDFKDSPRIINFRHNPYVMFEHKQSESYKDGDQWRIRQHFTFYNIKTSTSQKISFADGYCLIGTFNLCPIMYSQGTFTDCLVLGKRNGKKLHLRVVRMPGQKILFETTTDAIDASSIDDGSLFYNMLQADYIKK